MPNIKECITKADRALRAGRIDEADAIFNTLLNGAGDLIPEDEGRALSGRGVLRYHQGRFDAAIADLREAGKLLKSVHGEKSSTVAGVTMFLGRAMVARGDIVPGCKLGHEALKNMEESLPDDAPLIAEACFLLSQAEYQLHDLDAAEALTRRAMTIWEKKYDTEEMGISTCLNNLGRIYEERGLLDKGIKFHRESLAMRRKIMGDHQETAFSMGNLGTALAMNKQWEEAARVLEECVDCYVRVGIKDGPKLEGYKQNLEVCRKALDDPEGTAFKQ